jgi:hypothetical protein
LGRRGQGENRFLDVFLDGDRDIQGFDAIRVNRPELQQEGLVSMFEAGGEIGVFRACGMPPVFFGEAIAGQYLPNLTYLLAFDNEAVKDASWKKFMAHPDWLALKADKQYKDTATKIQNFVLKPSKGSQL